jgi:lipid-A-disaccharide synthase
MRYYLIAGEASGDLHGSKLIEALRQLDAEAEIRAWGGDLMADAGAQLVKHYRDLAFMGFWEVVKNLPAILRNLAFCRQDILQWQPEALILIDYPGFNLRIARWAHHRGIRVFYYISPQLWAWHSSRVNSIKKSVDRMFVILPFEQDFYRQYQYEVDFVGHPLLDVVTDFHPSDDFHQRYALDQRPIIALLPGSRRQEISRMLPLMLSVVAPFGEYQCLIAGAPAIPATFYHDIIQASGSTGVSLIGNETYALLAHARAAIVTSGTATLETALFNVPQIVCYKGSSLSFWLARQLVQVPFISLVNLIAAKPVVRELIQHECTPETMTEGLQELLDEQHAKAVREQYRLLRDKLGQAGAARRTAALIVADLR